MASWKYFNANPRLRKVGDCTVRAISTLLDEEWGKTFVLLCLEGYIECDMPSSNNVWQSYLKARGYKRHSLPDECPECYTVKDFCEDHPKGKYLLGLDGHVVTVIDSVYYDTWDCGDETVIYYFEREGTQK